MYLLHFQKRFGDRVGGVYGFGLTQSRVKYTGFSRQTMTLTHPAGHAEAGSALDTLWPPWLQAET